MSVGWAPAADLLYQAGTKMHFDDHLQQFIPENLPTGVFACGRVGYSSLSRNFWMVVGRAGGSRLLGAGEVEIAIERIPSSHAWAIVEHPAGKNFVDFDEDLQFKDSECSSGGVRQH